MTHDHDPNSANKLTMKDAAKRLKVSRGTLKRYFADGILDEPGYEQQGFNKVRIFTEDYLKTAEEKLERMREERSK